MKNIPRNIRLIFALAVCITFLMGSTFPVELAQTTDNEKVSLEAFDKILKVLKSPRCMNCHPSDDFPRQGDDRHVHLHGVMRGEDNHGGPVQKCLTCHQAENNEYSGVPGAPHWGLAPKSMGWQGLSDVELGKALLDKSKNGNRSAKDIADHMMNDALVLWAWAPGETRSLPPVPLDEFKEAVKTWLENGAIVPE